MSIPRTSATDLAVARRLIADGPNELVEVGARSIWAIAWEQVTATMVVILIVAAVVLAALGDYIDAGVILAIVVLNATLGFHQEFRAEKAIAALKQFAVHHATCVATAMQLVVTGVVFAVVEIEKWLRRRRPVMLISPAVSTAA